MSDRFTQLYAISDNLYSCGVPILVSAGRLYKNNQDDRVFVQLKMQNISANYRTIKAVRIIVTCFDITGNHIGEKEHQYLDLNVERGAEFGQKVAIFLDNETTRSFSVKVIEVVFDGKEVWRGKEYEWTSLGQKKTVEESLGSEMASQYRRDTFMDAKYEVFAKDGMWMCACGAFNHIEEGNCCLCDNSKSALFLALDHGTLSKNFKQFQEEEKQKEIIRNEENAKRAAKVKKKAIKLTILLALVLAAVSSLFFIMDAYLDTPKKEALRQELLGTDWGYHGVVMLSFPDSDVCQVRENGESQETDYSIGSVSAEKAKLNVGNESYLLYYTIDDDGNYEIEKIVDDNNIIYSQLIPAAAPADDAPPA